jgi:cation transport ATPase
MERHVPMSFGVLAHEGGTILVVANSLRLLFVKGFERRPNV